MTKRICLIYLSVFIKEREEKRGSDFRWCGRELAIWAEQWKREIGTLPQRARITVYGFRKHSGGRNDGIYQFAQKYAYVSQLAAHTSVQIAARLNRYGKSGRRPGESRSIKKLLSLNETGVFQCRRPESNRYGYHYPRDFKSRASASSATAAFSENLVHTCAENKGLYTLGADILKLILVCKWAKVDSNHRRQCQQIYSLSPLATREFAHALFDKQ